VLIVTSIVTDKGEVVYSYSVKLSEDRGFMEPPPILLAKPDNILDIRWSSVLDYFPNFAN
jgi:hypothetical protein